MITPKQIEQKTMTPEKRETAKQDLFAFYIGRPITYVLTIPFLYLGIAPNTVSWLSFIPVFLGFILLWLGNTTFELVLGWFCFFFWSMLDGVDGNIARYNHQFSKMGDTLDAAVGYFAMALIPVGAGIAAAHHPGGVGEGLGLPMEIYIILGALSGLWTILPRLIMHKAINSTGENNVGGVKDKKKYSIAKVIGLNLTSPPGAVQVFLLLSIVFKTLDIYTICYLIINTMVMVLSMNNILNDKEEI